jgi:hypothetical protein
VFGSHLQVENSFRWVKYGESPDGKKVLTKKTSLRFLVQLCVREYRFRKVNWEVKASAAATRSRSDKSTQDHGDGFSDGITDHAYALANAQWDQSDSYDVQRCSCDSDVNTPIVKWRVKLSQQPKASSLPVRSWWRTRIVSVHKNDANDESTVAQRHLRCSCPYWRAWGIPCRHVLRVFRLLKRKLILSDVDMRYWVEMYRAEPKTIRDLLWSPTTGIFARAMPEGPAITLTPIVLMSPDCDSNCDDPTVLSSWVDGDPTTAENVVDASDPMGISFGTSNKRPSLFSNPSKGSKGTEQSSHLYTSIKTVCENICSLTSDHPTIEQPVLTMLQTGLTAVLELLPANERASAADLGKNVVPALRGPSSSDDRRRGKGEYPIKRKTSVTIRKKRATVQRPSSQQKAKKKQKKSDTLSTTRLNKQHWDSVKRKRSSNPCT